MKRNIILLFFAFVVLDVLAKANDFSANDSVCIIEGTIKNIPDGCDVILYGSAGKYSGKQKTVAQIKKGKFHFEKKVKGDEHYCLYLYPCVEALDLYVSPKTKTTITGNGTHPSTWITKSNNTQQQEWNAYQKIEADSLPEYTTIRLRLNKIEAELYKNKTESEKESLLRERKQLEEKQNDLSTEYVKVMYNFMKEREYSFIFASKLKSMSKKVLDNLMEDKYTEMVIELVKKVPQKYLQNKDIIDAKKIIGLNKDPHPREFYAPTSKMVSTSAKDKGWCTFYDADKSYEVDGHTDVYIIRWAEKGGVLELSDKTERIIPAGCPVILHLNNEMEDGTYRSVLREADNNNETLNSTRWNVLDITSAGENISAWRLAFSTDNNEVALYPWTSNHAEAGIVYLRMPNCYADFDHPEISAITHKLNIGIKKPIAHTLWHTRDMHENTYTLGCNINYSPNVTITNNDIKAIYLKGEPVKIAKENRYVYLDYMIGNVAIAHKIGMADTNFHLCKFGKDALGAPEQKLTNYIYPRYCKEGDNSLGLLDAGVPVGVFSFNIIKDPISVDSFNDSTKLTHYDLSNLDSLVFMGSNFCRVSDSTLLAPCTASYPDKGMAFNHIFSIIDYKNRTCTPLKFWPNDGYDISDLVKHTIYAQGTRVYSNYKGRYIAFFHEGRNLMQFSINGDSIQDIRYIYYTPIDYNTKDGYNPMSHSLRTEELSCQTTSDKILILLKDRNKYGKKIRIEDYTRKLLCGNTIEMYDWEGGQQKKIIKLDHLGNRIMLSDDNKTLYLFIDDHTDRDSNPQIWAYDISNIDSQTGEEYIAETYEYADDISQDTVKISSSKKQSDIVEEDDMMVDFELYDYDDTPHHLNEFVGTGKYTILEFSSLACAPCQQIKPILKEFYINHKDQYELITISNDMEEIWKEHKEEKVIWHEWNDHQKARDIIKKYNVMGVPTFFIIDPNGKVLKKCVGIHSFFNSMSLYIPSHKLKKYLMIGSTK